MVWYLAALLAVQLVVELLQAVVELPLARRLVKGQHHLLSQSCIPPEWLALVLCQVEPLGIGLWADQAQVLWPLLRPWVLMVAAMALGPWLLGQLARWGARA